MRLIAILSLASCLALSACSSEQRLVPEQDAMDGNAKPSGDEAKAATPTPRTTQAPASPTSEAHDVAQSPEGAASPNGWPTDSCDFLPALATRGYRNDFDDEFGCSSPYKDIGAPGAAGLPNNLAYYGYGKATLVERLKLVVNYNAPGDSKEATRQLVEQAKLLSRKAAQVSLPASIETALRRGTAARADAGGVHHEVTREDWPTGIGYEVHYALTKGA